MTAGARVIDRLGVCQWFHYRAYGAVERAVGELRALGVRHLRTGVSWADFHRPGGRAWYDWQMRALAEFDVLLSVWHTPPSIAESGACEVSACASPPRRLSAYAEFIAQLIELYGDQFGALELWNEPNNRYKWAFDRHDPDWSKFGAMIRAAATTARAMGKITVLGGMIPVDHHWLALMQSYGALDAIDVVAIHGFPGMWWSDAPSWDCRERWRGWSDKLACIAAHAGGRPVWITETGLATWDLAPGARAHHGVQVARLREAAAAPVDRVYWYSLIDLDPGRAAIEGFHVDENEYHMGLVDWAGRRKPAWAEMARLLETGRAGARERGRGRDSACFDAP